MSAQQLHRTDDLVETALAWRERDVTRRKQILFERERELTEALGAIAAQRAWLEALQSEYESRREILAARTREAEFERERLREERARYVMARVELDEPGRTFASA